MKFTTCFLAILMTVALAQAGTITDGTASFTTTALSYDTTPTVDFRFPATTDHLFEMGWWYRLDGGTAESVFGAPTSETPVGNVMTVHWDAIGATGLAQIISADLVQTLIQVGNLATLTNVLTLTNNDESGRDAILDLFHYIDPDVQPFSGNDSATGGLGGITVTDPNGIALYYTGVGPSAYAVTTFATLRSSLSDASVTNFGDTGLPFGPGDFTGGFQWASISLPGLSQLSFTTQLQIDTGVVPEPGSIMLLGAGLAGLYFWRRKRAA